MAKTKEIWKEIPGYRGFYQISNRGRIKSYHQYKIRLLKPHINHKGYLACSLTIDGYSKHWLVHRLIALTFLPKQKNGQCINHIDGNKTNNHIGNLEWVSNVENVLHYRTKHKLFTGSNQSASGNTYSSEMWIRKQFIYLGSYKTPEEAHIAYLMASIILLGKNKYLAYELLKQP